MTESNRLRAFVNSLAALPLENPSEALLKEAATLLAQLVAQDDWLPNRFAEAGGEAYRRNLLHCDSRERFSVVSFVWGPGQTTPIHDHGVWGVVGMLRGVEMSQGYLFDQAGLRENGPISRMDPGEVTIISPAHGDIHRVWNESAEQAAVSIHIYGGNIGGDTRRRFEKDGSVHPFVSAYSNFELPNIWGPVAEGIPS